MYLTRQTIHIGSNIDCLHCLEWQMRRKQSEKSELFRLNEEHTKLKINSEREKKKNVLSEKKKFLGTKFIK